MPEPRVYVGRDRPAPDVKPIVDFTIVNRYHAVAGDDQLFTLHSRTMLQPDTWTHVAVVQAKTR